MKQLSEKLEKSTLIQNILRNLVSGYCWNNLVLNEDEL